MFSKLSCIPLTFLLFSMFLNAEDAVTVDRVKFKTLAERWVQVEIELTCNGNTNPEAANKDFVDNITVKPLLAYKTGDGSFNFYTSEVEIMIMEARDTNTVFFYMPGLVMERDELRGDPEYYYIEIAVGGQVIEAKNGPALSSSLKGAAMLQNMQQKADEQASRNKDILMPSYFAPAQLRGDSRKEPIYIRREVQSGG